MATRMSVKCKNCGNKFYVFWSRYNENNPIECPYCDCSLPEKYNKYIKAAFGAVWELNYQIRSKHEDGYCDLFEFGFKEIHVPTEKFKFSKEE